MSQDSCHELFSGVIDDQNLADDYRGGLQLWLTVRIDQQITEQGEAGPEAAPCAPFTKDVVIGLPEEAKRLRIGFDHLRRLGFDDDELARLHPEHPQFVNLTGKRVFVRPRTVGDQVFWNLCWPRLSQKPLDIEAAKRISEGLRHQIVAARAGSQAADQTHPTKGATPHRQRSPRNSSETAT